ncbi:MAG TPA: hypothetical protein VFE05_09360 [Longimicrobiaceae bacterium]|jgi:hypothetical protein|nr:hypothetical protein [Longimicrobiaceae bacterium]
MPTPLIASVLALVHLSGAPAAHRPAEYVRSVVQAARPAADDTVPLALAAQVVRYLQENGVMQPTGRLIFWTDTARTELHMQLAGSNVAPEVARGLRPIVEQYAAAWPGSGPIRAAIRLDAPDAYLVDPPLKMYRTAAAPEVSNVRHVQDLMRQMLDIHSPTAPERAYRPIPALLSIRVGADGSPEIVNVTRLTGDPELDDLLIPLAYEIRFRPAHLNGHGVAVWVSIPLNMEFAG